MQSDMERIDRIIERQKVDLESIYDGVTEGTREGVREGVVNGLKKGVQDGIKECIFKDVENMVVGDIAEIVEDIPKTIIKTNVREVVKYGFKKSLEVYLRRVSNRIVEEIRKRGIKLNKGQTGFLAGLIRKGHQESINKLMEGIPKNPFFTEAIARIQEAFEESLTEESNTYEVQLQEEIANQS